MQRIDFVLILISYMTVHILSQAKLIITSTPEAGTRNLRLKTGHLPNPATFNNFEHKPFCNKPKHFYKLGKV